MKKKILFITSLFPSINDPSCGSFIFEQIILTWKQYDVKIIVENEFEIGKKRFFKLLFTCPKLLFIHRMDKEYQNPDLNILALRYPVFTFYIPKFLQFCLIKNSFIKVVIEMYGGQNWVPDIIHAHYLFNSGIFAHQISKKYNIPYIVTEHNPVYFNNEYWSKKAKKAYLNSAFFFVVSHHEYRRFLTYNIDKKPLILNNFVDEERFNIKLKNQKCFTVLYVGYPHPLKGMKALFKIITTLKNMYITDIVFKIVSPVIKSDDFPNGVDNYIEDNGLKEYCELVHKRKNSDMPELYQNSDILLSTSINETFGLSILEALMCGIPVVSTKSGGPEDFLNEENSLLFQIDDINSIVQAIIDIKNKIISFNNEGVRSTVIEKFNKNHFLQNISSHYEAIIN